MSTSHNDFEEFAKFVARSIFEDDFEENPGWFVEVACRKLVKLGIVKFSEDQKQYSIELDDEFDDMEDQND